MVTGLVHAEPAEKPTDQGLLMSTTLFTQLDQVRHNVADKASDLVGNALGFLGVPYRRGGSSAETGFDCSGYVKAIYEQTIGLVLPRKASQQAAVTQRIDKSDLQPGDLVFFNTMRRAFSHVGIYIGDGKFVHSPRSGSEVRVESMDLSYWKNRFDGARRVLNPGETNPQAATTP
jgi:cell wall-associated NlpC family hydrolase